MAELGTGPITTSTVPIGINDECSWCGRHPDDVGGPFRLVVLAPPERLDRVAYAWYVCDDCCEQGYRAFAHAMGRGFDDE